MKIWQIFLIPMSIVLVNCCQILRNWLVYFCFQLRSSKIISTQYNGLMKGVYLKPGYQRLLSNLLSVSVLISIMGKRNVLNLTDFLCLFKVMLWHKTRYILDIKQISANITYKSFKCINTHIFLCGGEYTIQYTGDVL